MFNFTPANVCHEIHSGVVPFLEFLKIFTLGWWGDTTSYATLFYIWSERGCLFGGTWYARCKAHKFSVFGRRACYSTALFPFWGDWNILGIRIEQRTQLKQILHQLCNMVIMHPSTAGLWGRGAITSLYRYILTWCLLCETFYYTFFYLKDIYDRPNNIL